jgi:hypothetical protein
MVAKVTSIVSNVFVKYPEDDIGVVELNMVFANIEESINYVLKKVRDRGFFMEDLVLDRVDNITQVVTVTNSNIDKVNLFIRNMNKLFSENYLLQKEILETMSIDVVNDDSIAAITIARDNIGISMANGQFVTIKEDIVSSTKDGTEQVITHA